MKNYLRSSHILLCLLLMASQGGSAFDVRPVRAESTITVPDDYLTIQAAINAANSGDSIYVKADTYYEHVVVNKSLSLIGADRFSTIIDGNYTGNVMIITASNVTITGFTVCKSGFYPNRGIYGESITGGNISFNIFRDNLRAIQLSMSTNNTISKNNLISNTVGIFLTDGSSYNKITNNTIIDGSIGLSYSNENIVHGNRIRNSGSGIALDLYHCAHNSIIGNDLSESSSGVHVVSSHNNNVSGNIVKNCKRGFFVYGSPRNRIWHNNVMNSTLTQAEIATLWSPNTWDDGYPSGGNYWSDYNGPDLYSGPYQNKSGSDGIGDTLYAIGGGDNVDNYPLMNPITLSDYPIPADLAAHYFPILIFDEQEKFYPSSFMYDNDNIYDNPEDYDTSWPLVSYAHTTEITWNDENYLAVEYWFYYARDNGFWDTDLLGGHDHDWESIYIFFLDYSPKFIAYFHHTTLSGDDLYCVYDWDSSSIDKTGDHPWMHVARSSHASYPNTFLGYSWCPKVVVTEPCKSKEQKDYDDFTVIFVDEPEPVWPDEKFGTIDAPWARERWNNAATVLQTMTETSYSLIGMEEDQSKLYIHLYDSELRHIGNNYDSNTTEIGISGAYYEESGNTTIIMIPANLTDFKLVVDAAYAHGDVEEYHIIMRTVRNGEIIDEDSMTSTIEKGTQQELNSELDDFGNIVAIPEFPPFLIFPLFMLATLLATIFYRRKRRDRKNLDSIRAHEECT